MTTFTFGGVFSRFFKIIGDNVLLLSVLGLVAYILPAAAINYGMFTYAGITQVNWPQKIQGMPPIYWAWLGAGTVLAIAFQLFNLAAMTEVVILRAVGKPISAGAVISHALGNIVPILIISIMVFVVTLGATCLLIVPGVMFMLASYVAIPARVGEPGLGLWGSIKRSFDLTRNHRWLIWGLLIVFGFLFGTLSGSATMTILQFGGVNSLASTMAQVVVSGVVNVLHNVLVVAIYVSLRESKDKVKPDETANVFA